jgi:vancomycin resistance protein YoaR
VKRRFVIVGLVLGSLFLISWLGAWLWVGGQVPRNTRVLGVEIGARSQGNAIANLESRFADKFKKPIEFEAVGKRLQVKQENLGARIDLAATIAGARHRPMNPLTLLSRVFSSADLRPVFQIDQTRFTQAIDDLAKRSEVPVQEGSIAFNGLTPVAILPTDGESIDKRNALEVFKAKWLRSSYIALPTLHQHALVTSTEVTRSIQQIAIPAVSAPITVNINGHDLLIGPSSIAASISFSADLDGKLSPHFSTHQLSVSIGEDWLKLVPPAIDATLKFVNDRPSVHPSAVGRTITDESLTQSLTPILTAIGTSRRAVIVTTVLEPRISTEDIGGLGIKDQITKYTTYFPPAAYRIQNIHRAADLIDGTVVMPRGLFSLNRTVGERTETNGFAVGIVIYNGRFARDFGGGVSQVATTTWNAAWFSGIELIEHMAHSFYISRYPQGREATVAWPRVDLKFRNDTDHALLVHTSYTNSSLTIYLYGTRKYDVETIAGPRMNVTAFRAFDDDSPSCVGQQGVVGFDIDVTRVLISGGLEVSRQTFHTHYVPEDRITCTNPAASFGH